MENNRNYPYLGELTFNGKTCVVLFTEPTKGVVVMSEETVNPKFKFGVYNTFDEDMFEYLSPEECVRISN